MLNKLVLPEAIHEKLQWEPNHKHFFASLKHLDGMLSKTGMCLRGKEEK